MERELSGSSDINNYKYYRLIIFIINHSKYLFYELFNIML
jgi:hypothetical protein